MARGGAWAATAGTSHYDATKTSTARREAAAAALAMREAMLCRSGLRSLPGLLGTEASVCCQSRCGACGGGGCRCGRSATAVTAFNFVPAYP